MESVSCAFVPSLSLANKSCCAVPLQAVHCSPVLLFYHFFSFLPIKTFIFLCCYAWTLQGRLFWYRLRRFEEAFLFNLLMCFSAFCVSMSDHCRRRNGESRCCLWQTVGWEAPTHQQSYEGDKQRNKGGRKQGKTNKQRMIKIQMDDLANVLNKWWRVGGEIVSIRKFVSWTTLPHFQ